MRNFNRCRTMTSLLILNYTIDEQLSLTQDQGLSDEIHHILKGLTGRQKRDYLSSLCA